MDIKIVLNYGHYDVYIDGKFYCSADTYDEAYDEITKIFSDEQMLVP